MKMIKKINIGGAFTRKEDYTYEGVNYEADIQNNDIVKILSEGEVLVGQYGEQQVFKIETRNGDKNYKINQTSVNILVDEFGDDSKDWIGKEVKVLTQKGTFGGERGIASYLVVDGWKIDDYGKLVQSVVKKQREKAIEEAEEINPEKL